MGSDRWHNPIEKVLPPGCVGYSIVNQVDEFRYEFVGFALIYGKTRTSRQAHPRIIRGMALAEVLSLDRQHRHRPFQSRFLHMLELCKAEAAREEL